MTLFNTTCPVPAGADAYGERGSSWTTMVIVALACSGVTLIIALSLCLLHLRRYRAPKEQRQILRIVFSVVIYSIVAFFELFDYSIAEYIDPIGDVYEAFGLCALFLLFLQYAAPTGKFDADTLSAAREAADTNLGFDWPRVTWVWVFQYPVVEITCVIAQEITQALGVYCVQSLDPQFAHLWCEVIESLSIGMCVYAILRFYAGMKATMKARRALSKIACFKAIVFIRFSQAWVFSTLLEHDIVKTSSVFSYNDIVYGVPAVLTCAEMVLFSLGFWYAYSSTEYGSSVHMREEPLPFGRAILHALNPADLFMGIVRAVPFTIQLHRNGDWKVWAIVTWDELVKAPIRRATNLCKTCCGCRRRRAPSKDLDAFDRDNSDISYGPSSRYQPRDVGMDSLARPQTPSPPAREYPIGSALGGSAADIDGGGSHVSPYYSAASPRRVSGSEEASQRLMPDPRLTASSAAAGAAADALSSSPARSPPQSHRFEQRVPATGRWSVRRYDRSPSPEGRSMPAPMYNREII